MRFCEWHSHSITAAVETPSKSASCLRSEQLFHDLSFTDMLRNECGDHGRAP